MCAMRLLLRTAPAKPSCAAVLAFRKHAFTTSSSLARVPSKKRSYQPKTPHSPFKQSSMIADKLRTAQNPGVTRKTYSLFRNKALDRFDLVMSTSRSWAAKNKEYQGFGLNSKLDLEREIKLFRITIEQAFHLASQKHAISKAENPLFWALRNAFIERDMTGLADELVYGFQNFLMRSRFPKNILETHKTLADFRYPYEWFPATRALQRTIHLHVGPTNSGKTYNALKALENANSGIYAGPLRLLAHEVYTRFIAKGKKCALITGEEQRIPENEDVYFRSCTVEMTPLNHVVDVAVIDEIQMIGDVERGWAWTQAFLGVQAKEVHLCGEERTVELIESLCKTIGDKCVIHRYNRLSPLVPMDKSIDNDFKHLEKGDAVVTFSRVGIHAIKKRIEQTTKRRCAMVYGSLPPETRAQQAALFNDPDNDYDFLVASDAIGMGLNLEVKRVIFETTHKRTKNGYRVMTTSELKQIGGRAGRYKTARQANIAGPESSTNEEGVRPKSEAGLPGYVTTMDAADLENVKKAFATDAEPIRSAGIQPPPSVIERLSSYFPPNTPFSYILNRLRDIAQTSSRFHLCFMGEMLEIAELIQPFPMSVYDRCVFLNAPAYLRGDNGAVILQAFAKCVSRMEGGSLVDIPEVNLELLDQNETHYSPAEYLKKLEGLHKTITLYLWLSYRYSGVFCSQNLAFHVKEIVETKIDTHLSKVDTSESKRAARLKAMRSMASASEKKKKVMLGDDGELDGPKHELLGKWDEDGHEEPIIEDPMEVEPLTRSRRDSTHGRNDRAHATASS